MIIFCSLFETIIILFNFVKYCDVMTPLFTIMSNKPCLHIIIIQTAIHNVKMHSITFGQYFFLKLNLYALAFKVENTLHELIFSY